MPDSQGAIPIDQFEAADASPAVADNTAAPAGAIPVAQFEAAKTSPEAAPAGAIPVDQFEAAEQPKINLNMRRAGSKHLPH